MTLPKTTKVTIYLDDDQALLLLDWFELLERSDRFLTPDQFALTFLPGALVAGVAAKLEEAKHEKVPLHLLEGEP